MATDLVSYNKTHDLHPLPVDVLHHTGDCLDMDFACLVNCCLSAEEVQAIIAPVVPDQLRVADRYRGLSETYWTQWNDIGHRG
jgi:hypothetical protein